MKNDAHGTSVVGEMSDEASGPLTFNVATISIDTHETIIGIDMRIPVTIDKERLVEKLIEKASEYGLTYEEHDFLDALYVPAHSELITTLLGAYRCVRLKFREELLLLEQ